MSFVSQNHQWIATKDGLKKRTSGIDFYSIEADQLLATGGVGRNKFYDWPLHMAQKSWVDIDAFEEGFRAAIGHHSGKFGCSPDRTRLDDSFKAARCLRAKI